MCIISLTAQSLRADDDDDGDDVDETLAYKHFLRASAAQYARIYIRPFASACNAVRLLFFHYFFPLRRACNTACSYILTTSSQRRFAFHFNWFCVFLPQLVSFGVWPHASCTLERLLHTHRSINHHSLFISSYSIQFLLHPNALTDVLFCRYVRHTSHSSRRCR